jgi:hypothetical protein
MPTGTEDAYVIYAGATVYFVVGVLLTRSILKKTKIPLRFADVTVGAFFMPVIFLFDRLLILLDHLWFSLLLLLDFQPER